MRRSHAVSLALVSILASTSALAQDNPTGDPIVQKIYDEGMHRSQASRLAQVLMDSIGPRLTGSPANRAANEWLLRTYKAWGVDAKNEQYGTWRDWTRGPSRLELVAPRVRVLEATMHAWSAATPAGGVTADVVIIPTAAEIGDSAGFVRWLGGVKGKLVLASMPQTTCRPDSDLRFWADSAVYHHAVALRDSAQAELERAAHRGARERAHARSRARACRRRRDSVEHVVARVGRGQDPVGARDARPVVRRFVRGLHAARAARVQRAASASATRSPRPRWRRTRLRSSTPSPGSTDRRSPTST